MTRPLDRLGVLDRYTAASEQVAGGIIDLYSTSFGASTRLLGPRHRRHVRNIYALVRVADELVDGATAEAGLSLAQQHAALTGLEEETARAIDTGYSSNPVVHAFATTARVSGIDRSLTTPFFASMRTDLTGERDQTQCFGTEAHDAYVYGSAEVIGLMCLRVFLREEHRTPEELRVLEDGARKLGAAFQNVNFLRDLADDTQRLGRSYLDDSGRVDAATKERWIQIIRAQLADAARAVPLLPRDARVAVASAQLLFSTLTDRIARTPSPELYRERIRIPTLHKAVLIGQAALHERRERTS
jgi:phytoene/squalene synthetase